MGISGKKLHRDERRAIVRRRLRGESIRRVADRMGVSTRTVQQYAPPELLERLRAFVGRFGGGRWKST